MSKANLPLTVPSSLDEVLSLYAKLKLQNPSLAWRGLYDLYAWFSHGIYPDLIMQTNLRAQFKALPPIYTTRTDAEISYFMQQALDLARVAYEIGEVPVGAVIVCGDEIVGRGYNQTKLKQSSVFHAEVAAIQDAESLLADVNRLSQCDMFVTLEPCLMCSGAIINSRLRRVYYAIKEPKTGACISQYSVFNNRSVNFCTEAIGLVSCNEAVNLLQNFFQKLRRIKNSVYF